MPNKQYKPEEIVRNLRTVEIEKSKGEQHRKNQRKKWYFIASISSLEKEIRYYKAGIAKRPESP